MATRVILAAIVVEIDDRHGTDLDLVEGVQARLDEFYPTDSLPLVPTVVRATVVDERGLTWVRGAVDVSVEGIVGDDERAHERAAGEALADDVLTPTLIAVASTCQRCGVRVSRNRSGFPTHGVPSKDADHAPVVTR